MSANRKGNLKQINMSPYFSGMDTFVFLFSYNFMKLSLSKIYMFFLSEL